MEDSWIPAINSMPQTNMEGTSLDNIQAHYSSPVVIVLPNV